MVNMRREVEDMVEEQRMMILQRIEHTNHACLLILLRVRIPEVRSLEKITEFRPISLLSLV